MILAENLDNNPITEFAVTVHNILCREYGCPVAYFHSYDPLSELVSALLSHRTKNSDSGKAFNALKNKFSTWEAVRDAPVDEVQEAINYCTWPEQKAPRIQAVLKEITIRRKKLSLDFLKDLSVAEARNWLQSISGVGPKTSAATLSFSNLRMKALPVDSHHYRVAIRLGLIPQTTTEAKAHILLEKMLPHEWTAQDIYDNHEVMMFHGQRCCFWRNPDCHRCVVLNLCPTGQKVMGEENAKA